MSPFASYDHLTDSVTHSVPTFRVPLVRGTEVVDGRERLIIVEPKLPERATTEAAAFDVEAFLPDGPVLLHPLKVVKVRTGLHVALPAHSALLVCSRSGLAAKGIQVINAPGIVDSDYRDEISVLLSYINTPDAPPIEITHGMRIAQFLYVPPGAYPSFHRVNSQNELTKRESNRRGGFGSTGL